MNTLLKRTGSVSPVPSHLPALTPRGEQETQPKAALQSATTNRVDFGGNLSRLPKKSLLPSTEENIGGEGNGILGSMRLRQPTETIRSTILSNIKLDTPSGSTLHQRAAIIAAATSSVSAASKAGAETVTNLPSPPQSLKRTIQKQHRSRQILQSVPYHHSDDSTIPPALRDLPDAEGHPTVRNGGRGLKERLKDTLASAQATVLQSSSQEPSPQPHYYNNQMIPAVLYGNGLRQETINKPQASVRQSVVPIENDDDVVIADNSLKESTQSAAPSRAQPSLMMSSDDLANSGKLPPTTNPMIALVRGQDSPNTANHAGTFRSGGTEPTPPSHRTINTESPENAISNTGSPPPPNNAKATPRRRMRPKSAHSDYEKYVRDITGGQYLKERYSDHIKVSTKMILGRGAFGVVYSGVNEKTGQIVAVKHMPIDAQRPSIVGDAKPARPLSASPTHKELLRASQIDECFKSVVEEIRLMAQLKHPNIVQYYHAEIVGPRWEEVYERRHKYLTQQRRRVQQYERSILQQQEEDGGITSPLSPLLAKEGPLPPMEPPSPDLTAPPPPTGIRYLVICMEYMSGGSLGSLMAKMLGDKNTTKTNNGTKKERPPPRIVAFSEKMIKVYFKQVLAGLVYLHEHKIVHRDIKADNLLLSASDGAVRISDFGTSRKFADVSALGCSNAYDDDGGGQRALMTLTGTPSFMAPEMVKGSGHSYPADIWSIGATIIHLLTGQAPFEQYGQPWTIMYKISEEPEKIIESIPEDASILMKDFILKCVAPDPQDRWTAQQLLAHPFIVEEEEDGYFSSDDDEESQE